MSLPNGTAAELERLPSTVFNRREQLGLSLRAAGKQMGLDHGTLSRFERGAGLRSENLIAVVRWCEDEPAIDMGPGAFIFGVAE